MRHKVDGLNWLSQAQHKLDVLAVEREVVQAQLLDEGRQNLVADSDHIFMGACLSKLSLVPFFSIE